ncbi:PAAR domain-containing protein [Archangium violaceum]|uniref:PAAR domain-containing protein n=1 Tax=Archangium violaceum TaxID=83451 RepID=UPI002B306C62|nr:PAAR domain-containing protein [Archangium gephyra]
MHTCPKTEPGPVPHVGGPVSAGEATVLIGYMPAARVGDMAVCMGPPDSISQGESSVIIGGKPAARLGDPTSHGGVVVVGCPTVLIGAPAQSQCMASASESGAAFVTPAE